MTYPSDDLTKLTGPELAERLLAVYGDPNGYHPEAVEAGHRLREDTREWQRRLERERDGLRATVSRLHADMRELDDQRELLAIRVRELEAQNPPEPAERKPHEGRVYGESDWGRYTADSAIRLADQRAAIHQLALHLRELLDERKAIEALADRWLSGAHGSLMADAGRELREVLNGK